jgi:hypothetical protein
VLFLMLITKILYESSVCYMPDDSAELGGVKVSQAINTRNLPGDIRNCHSRSMLVPETTPGVREHIIPGARRVAIHCVSSICQGSPALRLEQSFGPLGGLAHRISECRPSIHHLKVRLGLEFLERSGNG